MPTFHTCGQKSIIFLVLRGISSSDSPHRQEKTQIWISNFIIFLHIHKVSLILISAAACEKALDRTQSWIELGQKFAKNNVFEILRLPN